MSARGLGGLKGSVFRLREAGPTSRRLLLFHHGGGSALSYADLVRDLPAWVECLSFELPGRGFRSAERFERDFASAAAGLLADVAGAVDRDTVLFGHSLGGLLAHWLACMLPASRQRHIRRVIISGARHPASVAAEGASRSAPRESGELANTLRSLGGTPEELLSDPDILGALVRLLGHDLRLLDTYQRPARSVDAPVEVWAGDSDPAVTPADITRWRLSQDPPATVRLFRGGHFYLFSDPAVRAELERVISE